MRKISTFLKYVATPSLFCIFIILGLTAAAISGIVECIVIREFLSGTDFRGSRYIPVIMVVILEGLKLFLHYAIPAHEKIDDCKNLLAKKITKNVLVLFSLLCTIVYSSTAMYQPQVVDEAIAVQTAEVNSELQKELDQNILKIEANSQIKLQDAKNQVNAIINEIEQLSPIYRPLSAYTRYVNEKQRLEEKLSNAQNAYEMQAETIAKERDEKIAEAKLSYEEKLNHESSKTEEELKNAGDNVYLSSALLFFSSLFGSKNYSRVLYYMCVLLISIIVSVVLELTIAFSQAYLSLNVDKLEQLFGSPDNNVTNRLIKRKAAMAVSIIVQAAIMLSVCLICAAFTETFITEKGMVFAFLSYFASIILTFKKHDVSLNTEKASKNKLVSSVIYAKSYFLPIVVQTLICIAGFLILNYSMGNTSSNSTLTTIALSVGSVSGQIILKPQYEC